MLFGEDVGACLAHQRVHGLVKARDDGAHGQYAGAPPASQHRPQKVRIPFSRASLATSSASLLFPIPGSPVRYQTEPRPSATSSMASVRRMTSRLRPTMEDCANGCPRARSYHALARERTGARRDATREPCGRVGVLKGSPGLEKEDSPLFQRVKSKHVTHDAPSYFDF